MTIVLRHNEDIELNLVEYLGAVTLAELRALADYAALNPGIMQRDSLNLIHPGARFADVSHADLDALFARYRALYAPLQFVMLRRSAWVCRSASAADHLRHWLSGDARQAMSSVVRQFDTLDQAAEWLVLHAHEIAAADRGEGFEEVAHFDIAPVPGVGR